MIVWQGPKYTPVRYFSELLDIASQTNTANVTPATGISNEYSKGEQ